MTQYFITRKIIGPKPKTYLRVDAFGQFSWIRYDDDNALANAKRFEYSKVLKVFDALNEMVDSNRCVFGFEKVRNFVIKNTETNDYFGALTSEDTVFWTTDLKQADYSTLTDAQSKLNHLRKIILNTNSLTIVETNWRSTSAVPTSTLA